MHTPGAKVDKIIHLAVRSCVLPHIKVLICQEKPAHTGCKEAKICAHGTQIAPLILNTDIILAPGRLVMFHGPYYIQSVMQAGTTPIFYVFG